MRPALPEWTVQAWRARVRHYFPPAHRRVEKHRLRGQWEESKAKAVHMASLQSSFFLLWKIGSLFGGIAFDLFSFYYIVKVAKCQRIMVYG
jgi:hypothetical protein